MRNRLRLALALCFPLSVALGAAPTRSAAATDPASRCAIAKQKAVAKSLKSSAKCYDAAASAGLPVDSTCLLSSATRLGQAFDRADDAGGCVTVANGATVATLLEDGLDAMAAAFPTTGGACATAHRKIAVRSFTDLTRCSLKAIQSDSSVAVECLQKAADRAEKRLQVLADGGSCASDPLLEPTIEVLASAHNRILIDTPAAPCPSDCEDLIDLVVANHVALYDSATVDCVTELDLSGVVTGMSRDEAVPYYFFRFVYPGDLCGPGGCYPNWESVDLTSVTAPLCLIHSHATIGAYAPISYRQWGACAQLAMAGFQVMSASADACSLPAP